MIISMLTNPVTYTAGTKKQNEKVNRKEAYLGESSKRLNQLRKDTQAAYNAIDTSTGKSRMNYINQYNQGERDQMAMENDIAKKSDKLLSLTSKIRHKVYKKQPKDEKRVNKIGKKIDKADAKIQKINRKQFQNGGMIPKKIRTAVVSPSGDYKTVSKTKNTPRKYSESSKTRRTVRGVMAGAPKFDVYNPPVRNDAPLGIMTPYSMQTGGTYTGKNLLGRTVKKTYKESGAPYDSDRLTSSKYSKEVYRKDGSLARKKEVDFANKKSSYNQTSKTTLLDKKGNVKKVKTGSAKNIGYKTGGSVKKKK
jgi:hypothetical protein